jgi:LPPG:FO 2-phospho-L-lactate transferase
VIWPDHDTVAYTLAGLDDEIRGWGLRRESWTVMDRLEELGEREWFRLGDKDLATHLWRTDRLRAGDRPTEVALALAAAMGIEARILPMADEPVRTEVRTDDGWLEFQEYFVHRHQEPTVLEVRFRGTAEASATPEVIAAIAHAEVLVIAPSNPIVSIDPILAVRGLQPAVEEARARRVPLVALSGIVGGKALKGPADRMLASLGEEVSALGVARRFAPLASHFVLDRVDAELAPAIRELGVETLVADTIMTSDASRARLAEEVLRFTTAPSGTAR